MGNVGNMGCRSKGQQRCTRGGHEDVNDPEKQGMSPLLSLQDKKVGFTKAITVVCAWNDWEKGPLLQDKVPAQKPSAHLGLDRSMAGGCSNFQHFGSGVSSSSRSLQHLPAQQVHPKGTPATSKSLSPLEMGCWDPAQASRAALPSTSVKSRWSLPLKQAQVGLEF